MTWIKQPPWRGPIHQGCAICPPVRTLAPLDMVIAVGFGSAYAMMGEDCIYAECGMSAKTHHYTLNLAQVMLACPKTLLPEGFPMLAHIEQVALMNPDHDWRVCLYAPLRDREYQRQGPGQWVLIASGPGFA